MLVKILGAVDLILGGILILKSLLNLSNYILLFCAIALLIKSFLGMLKNFASWIDFIGGVVFLLSIFLNLPTMICFIIGILIIQKGIFSFF